MPSAAASTGPRTVVAVPCAGASISASKPSDPATASLDLRPGGAEPGTNEGAMASAPRVDQMTARLVSRRLDFAEHRCGLLTERKLRDRTARVEMATGRWVQRARDVAL